MSQKSGLEDFPFCLVWAVMAYLDKIDLSTISRK